MSFFGFAMPLSQLFFWFCLVLPYPLLIPDFPPTILNHSANLEAINNYMAFDATQLLNETLEFQSNLEGYIELPLFDVDLFRKSKFKDYTSLILSTLARDRERVKRFTSTKITTVPDIFLEKYQGIYKTFLSAGTPRQAISLAVDMGSSHVWWNCIPCVNCNSFSFDPQKSSSFQLVDCLNVDDCPSIAYTCETQLGGRCKFKINYVDRSEASGFIANDKLLTKWGEPLLDRLNFGCAEFGVEAWIEREYDGILGFGRLPYSFVKQFKATSFSMCFKPHSSSSKSSLYLNQAVFPGGATTLSVPLISAYGAHYSIRLYAMFVEREFVPFYTNIIDGDDAWGELIVDSGSRISRFPQNLYDRFRDAFKIACTAFPTFEVKDDKTSFDTCYNVSGVKAWSSKVPPVVFHLGDTDGPLLITLDANQIFYPIYVYDGVYCLGFAPIQRADAILGTQQLSGTRVSVDLVYQFLNFDFNDC